MENNEKVYFKIANSFFPQHLFTNILWADDSYVKIAPLNATGLTLPQH